MAWIVLKEMQGYYGPTSTGEKNHEEASRGCSYGGSALPDRAVTIFTFTQVSNAMDGKADPTICEYCVEFCGEKTGKDLYACFEECKPLCPPMPLTKASGGNTKLNICKQNCEKVSDYYRCIRECEDFFGLLD